MKNGQSVQNQVAYKGYNGHLVTKNGYNTVANSAEGDNYQYMERIKEQELMYNLFTVLNNCKYLNRTLQSVVNLIPSGTQHPENINARLVYNNESFCSPGFTESATCLWSPIKTFNLKLGRIEVFYQPSQENSKFQPSYKEAQSLIDCIALILQGWLNKYETENHLQNMLADLETKIEERTLELKDANKALNQINIDVKDSINYANRIQRAVLPTTGTVKSYFEDAFILYKPKDIVSGDFFWVHESGDCVFYVCADCTGHGVPGALMSMVGNQLLDHIVTEKKIREPQLILQEMDDAIIKMFKKGMVDGHLRDGMALSLCVINKKTKKVSFAGACNNAYMISGNEVLTFVADRHSIGGTETEGGKQFTKTEFDYVSGDQLYMFTDGYIDQIGGPKEKKFMRKKLIGLISDVKHLNHDKQKTVLESYLTEWTSDNFQVDDVTVLGVKL